MSSDVLFHININKWVQKTINKVEIGLEWNDAWYAAYQELGGQSHNSGTKACPKNGARTLYQLGRIQNTKIPFQQISLQDVLTKYSKNGVYALLAIHLLEQNPNISHRSLWSEIQKTMGDQLHEEPATKDEGSVRVVSALWKLGQIVKE